MSESDPPPSSSATPTTKTRSFKPRTGIVRKSKADRDAHAKEEADKAAARAVVAQAAGRPPQVTKSTSTKKRDSTKDGQSRRDNGQNVSTGVLGAGTGARPIRGQRVVDEGYSERLGGQEATDLVDQPVLPGQDAEKTALSDLDKSRIGGSGGGKASRRSDDEITIESDRGVSEPRRNIEDIEISSDEGGVGDTAYNDKGKSRAISTAGRSQPRLVLRPVRAPRYKPEGQETEDSSGEDGTDQRRKKLRRVIPEEAESQEIEEIDHNDDAARRDPLSSPELSKKTKPAKRPGSKAKDTKVAFQTIEEKAERDRLDKEVEKLQQEFTLSPKIKRDEDNDVDVMDTGHDHKLFLFQFPPLVPFLADEKLISSRTPDVRDNATGSELAIKRDPDGPSATNSARLDGAASSGPELPKTELDGMLTASERLRLPSGRVGKLNIHKSGKVTLDWGGIDMEVRYGTEVDFLQDAVLVETPGTTEENGDQGTSTRAGTTYALGHVRKKMVVIPDWHQLYD